MLCVVLSNKIDGVMLTSILTAIADYIVADGEAVCLFVECGV